MFKGVEVPEHSLVVRETIGTADADTLTCESDYSPCCTDTENGWFFDFGPPNQVHITMDFGIYQTRDVGIVRMHNDGRGGADGMFYCQIRVSGTELQTLYVGIYPSVGDNIGLGVNGNGKSVCIPSEIHHSILVWIMKRYTFTYKLR